MAASPSNFSFLHPEFRELMEPAVRAERLVMPDPRAACFYARFALETAVQWLYLYDRGLHMPYDQSLGALLHEPSFQSRVPEAVFQKARAIQQAGNQAVHHQRPIQQFTALQIVKELHHVLYWLARTYTRQGATALTAVAFDQTILPPATPGAALLDRKRLGELESELEAKAKALAEQEAKVATLDAEIERLRNELAAVRTANEAQPDPHAYSEADTRKLLIDLELHRAGWALDQKRDTEFEVTGMPNAQGMGYVDYVLWDDNGKPLAIVEAKKTSIDPHSGQPQAKLYANCLEQMTGQRPIIFFTNGYDTWLWDDTMYPPRAVEGFYKKDELQRLLQRRSTRKELSASDINRDIADRYYQNRAIASIAETFGKKRRKALLVMATGTGKTRTVIALIDLLQRMNWVKRVLFLADRVSLVNQAVKEFKKHLPDSSPVNLVTEKNKDGRIYACTYPTMMGLIDETDDGEARFSIGHFDLVVIDEAHRSIYQRYRAIFSYFDSLLVGLTATPREEIDRNTYELFDLESGVPTDAYDLERAIADGFLVPPHATQYDLKFPRKGIKYDQLSDEDKARWEEQDWGDRFGDVAQDQGVSAEAVNKWLFNADTVDKMLQTLMENGHKVAAGDRLAKTILFARSHQHAVFIQQRFDFHYPQYNGHFAQVIDNQTKYAQSLIDQFSLPESDPHIAISVDMLDTGIDVPEVANLVFFKPVYSKVKFWQMIGRGTRLCPKLFGEGQPKTDFRIFDFCGNFEFFKLNPDGVQGTLTESLGTRLFKARVELIDQIQRNTELSSNGTLLGSLKTTLQTEVKAMHRDNFLVRAKLRKVEHFQQPTVWEQPLSEDALHDLSESLSRLPSTMPSEGLEPRLFDSFLLRMQLALAQGDARKLEGLRRGLQAIASELEEKSTLPVVQARMPLIQAIQDDSFWEGINLDVLEDIRLQLRGLYHLLERKSGDIVYTNFKDEILHIDDDIVLPNSGAVGVQYEKKVREYLVQHLDHIAILKLRQGQALTKSDLAELEQTLIAIGDAQGATLLEGLLRRSHSPTLVHFIRRIVGLDRQAVQAVFAEFLNEHGLTSAQTRFIETLIEQLTVNGIVETGALYEPPFSDLHADGPEGLFAGKERIVDGIFGRLEKLAAVDIAG